ncbi:MAG: hypothetical protein P1P76_09530 [Anaerolineales bacterium]|nr:hypothetical protein [Anaerolineales bacterium]
MITPAGSDCPFYYEDFHRGRERQECRLIDGTPNGGTYAPDLCAKCAVPGIVRANACPNLVLEARVRKGFLGLMRGVDVSAYCTRTMQNVAEPQIGCGQCHKEFPTFVTPPEDT